MIFKKNGRPTTEEKSWQKSISNFLNGLSDDEKTKHSFHNETITSKDRLKEIYDSISDNKEDVVQHQEKKEVPTPPNTSASGNEFEPEVQATEPPVVSDPNEDWDALPPQEFTPEVSDPIRTR